MSALLAIVGDTWRQSRQQIVFYLLIAAFLLSVVGFIGFPKVFQDADGKEFLGYVLQTKPESGMEGGWDAAYKNAVARDKNHTGRMKGVREAAIDSASKARLKKVTFEELKSRNASQAQQDEAKKDLEAALKDLEEKEKAYSTLKFDLEDEVNSEVQKRSEGVSKLKKGVEVWLALAVGWLFRISIVALHRRLRRLFSRHAGGGCGGRFGVQTDRALSAVSRQVRRRPGAVQRSAGRHVPRAVRGRGGFGRGSGTCNSSARCR